MTERIERSGQYSAKLFAYYDMKPRSAYGDKAAGKFSRLQRLGRFLFFVVLAAPAARFW